MASIRQLTLAPTSCLQTLRFFLNRGSEGHGIDIRIYSSV
jgi:hypothetical protein